MSLSPAGVLQVSEQYTLVERKKLAGVTTTGSSYTLKTTNARVIVISCANDSIIFDVNQTISVDSPRIAKDGSYSLTVGTLAQPITLYVKAETTTADVYIQVFA